MKRESLRHAAPHELSLDECMFIGFWLGDGTCTKLKTGGVEYVMYQGIKYDKLIAWFDALLDRLGIRCTQEKKEEQIFFYCRENISRCSLVIRSWYWLW